MLSIRTTPSLLRNFKRIACIKSFLPSNICTTTPFLAQNAPTKKVEFHCGGEKYIGTAKLGDTLLDVIVNNDLPLDGFGACEGTLACCTCHVILSPEHYERVDRLNPPTEEEMDLLDLAPELSDYSRLGCQIQVESNDPDVIAVKVPVEKRDLRVAD